LLMPITVFYGVTCQMCLYLFLRLSLSLTYIIRYHLYMLGVRKSRNIQIFLLIDQKSRSSMAPRWVRFGVRLRKLSNISQSLDGWPKVYYLELLRASEGILSRWSRLHLQSLRHPPTSTGPAWWVMARSPYV
jgi:hypothetical protein